MFELIGDQFQKAEQQIVLEEEGLVVKNEALTSVENFLAALDVLWKFKVVGFWNYYCFLIGLEICSEKRFQFAVRVLQISQLQNVDAKI